MGKQKTNSKESDFQITKCQRKCACTTSSAFASTEKLVEDTIVKKYAKKTNVKTKTSAEKDTPKHVKNSCHKMDADLEVVVLTNTHNLNHQRRKMI